jgi:hypothetical protein
MVVYFILGFLLISNALLFLSTGNLYNKYKKLKDWTILNQDLIIKLNQKMEQNQAFINEIEKKYGDAINLNSANIQCLIDILKKSNIIIDKQNNKRVPVA